MYALMMTADSLFLDQWCEGVFDTFEDAQRAMERMYESRLAEEDEPEVCHCGDGMARVEDDYGEGNQWLIVNLGHATGSGEAPAKEETA